MKKSSSPLVIIVPLLVAAATIAGILVYKSKTAVEQAPTPMVKTIVPTLRGSAGAPQQGFDTTKKEEASMATAPSAVSDLSTQLDSVSEDTADTDFQTLQSDTAKL